MLTDLQRERMYPYVAGLTACVVAIFVDSLGYKVPYNDSMLEALVSLGGIFAGFLATLKTLLAAMSNDTYSRLKDSGYITDLLTYLMEAIWGSLLLCVVAMFGFNGSIKYPATHAALLFGLLFFALMSLYRVTKIGMGLLTSR